MRARVPAALTLLLVGIVAVGGTPATGATAGALRSAVTAPPPLGGSATLADAAPAALPRASVRWVQRIRALVEGTPVSVAVGNDGDVWFRHKARTRRPPASNEKLLLSMALLQRFSVDRTMSTRAMAAGEPDDGVVRGGLWIVGAGDPETGPDDLAALADGIVAAGVTKIRGRVIGATTPFVRDWWAAGWRDYFPAVYIEIPTALTYRGNRAGGRHIADPERRAAVVLKRKLERRGVDVTRGAAMAPAPGGLVELAALDSAPLASIVRRMNVSSSNLRAEVLGKVLGRARFSQPSIRGGARAVEAFVRARGLDAAAFDSSGLSYANRVSARAILDLLWFADGRPWGAVLRDSLPAGGEGTLDGRLDDVVVRAKTGTLIDVSALSGWVWLERSQEWAEFSILTSGISASRAKSIENRIVTILANTGTDPSP